ncbi:hypothetical protein B484DRAFT_446981, partial [Ochromonadaceae sp. CCMP2298]
ADTAGIVEGSFREGAGVGVSSLECLRNADCYLHLLRQFEDETVQHYEGSLDLARDLAVVHQELLQTDLDLIEAELTQVEQLLHRGLGGDFTITQKNMLLRAFELVAGVPRSERPKLFKKNVTFKKMPLPRTCAGLPLRAGKWDSGERAMLADYRFLTSKCVLYLVNMSSRDFLRPGGTVQVEALRVAREAAEMLAGDGDADVLPVSLVFEEKLRCLERDEGAGALEMYVLANPTHRSMLPVLVQQAQRAIGLLHFYTADNREVRCFALKKGRNIMEASAALGVHVMRNFIRGDVVSYEDFRRYKGDRLKIMIEGRLKAETKKYIVNDGDIIDFCWHGQEKTV